jgi:hypothetical protein
MAKVKGKSEGKDESGGEKPGTIGDSNAKDDCSDLTENNNDPEEQTPKSFPQKVGH